ncbi:carbohydrate kinase family protein [Lysobacter korlensis]|uniref:Carbohydrate kinase family protein n=1 Tax=Lysobacter korlensis TaxID=553636 RepID=A0ABV6RSY8_9GAMM
MYSIAVAGHICVDLTPELHAGGEPAPGQLVEVGPLSIRVGGSVANTGLVLADLGAEVTPYTTIGADGLGALLTGELQGRGLDTSHVVVSPEGATSYSVVVERPGQDRTFWHHTGANILFDGADVDSGSSDILHVGYPPLLPALVAGGGAPLAGLLARSHAAGGTTSVDLSVVDPDSAAGAADWDAILNAMCAHTDVLSPSLDDLTSALRIEEGFSVALVDRLAARFLTAGVAVVAISAGPHGLFIRTGTAARFRSSGRALAGVAHWAERSLDVPPVAVDDVVTTNGAGDAASAGLLFAIAIGASLEEAGRISAACSAAVIQGRRATPATIATLTPGLGGLLAAGR